ncbi:MAG: hypothetical protein QXR19_04425 [Candidatus Jordarchaeaceae archaeon]
MRIQAEWGIPRHLPEAIRAALIEKLQLPPPEKTEYQVAVLIIDGVYPNGLKPPHSPCWKPDLLDERRGEPA